MTTEKTPPKKRRSKAVSQKRPAQTAQYAPITISEQGGLRYLHFGSVWIQGAMRISKPDAIALEYGRRMVSWMLFVEKPEQVLQLGLGTGALTKFAYRQFPEARVTAVELNPEVLAVCRSMFALPEEDERLQVVLMNALDYVQNPEHAATVDVLQVDLYDATAFGPVLDSAEFYGACFECLKPQGVMTVNLFGDHQSFGRNIETMKQFFPCVHTLPPTNEGNVIAVAFKTEPQWDAETLDQRAQQIKEKTKLNAPAWLKAFRKKPKKARAAG